MFFKTLLVLFSLKWKKLEPPAIVTNVCFVILQFLNKNFSKILLFLSLTILLSIFGYSEKIFSELLTIFIVRNLKTLDIVNENFFKLLLVLNQSVKTSPEDVVPELFSKS